VLTDVTFAGNNGMRYFTHPPPIHTHTYKLGHDDRISIPFLER